jgi:hypothetical protein
MPRMRRIQKEFVTLIMKLHLYTINTAVLPKPSLVDANINSAISAMLDIVQPKNDDSNENEIYDVV